MKRLILSLALFSGLNAYAYVDQRCAADCRAQGSGYAFCQQRCEFESMPQMPAFGTPQPDYACVRQCANAGYAYQFCQQRCR